MTSTFTRPCRGCAYGPTPDGNTAEQVARGIDAHACHRALRIHDMELVCNALTTTRDELPVCRGWVDRHGERSAIREMRGAGLMEQRSPSQIDSKYELAMALGLTAGPA